MSTTEYAGFWLRFVACIIDGLVLTVVHFLVIIPFFNAFFILPTSHPEAGEEFGQSGTLTWIGASAGWPELALLVIAIVYYSLTESSKYQASPGKLAMELKVTGPEEQRLTLAKATLRNISKIISFIPFMIGFVMVAFTARKQALHDIFAGSLVVKK